MVFIPQNIIDSFPAPLYAIKSKDIYRLLKNFRSDPAVESCYAFGEYLHLTLKDFHNGNEILDRLATHYQTENFKAQLITATIEDSFIRLMQEDEKAEIIEK